MHPKNFLSLERIIERQPLTVVPETPVIEVIKLMQKWGNSCSLATNENNSAASSTSTEPINREARQAMLQQAKTQGYIDNYSGVRISKTGRRFFIETAIIWNLLDPKGNRCGQAATFSHWVNC